MHTASSGRARHLAIGNINLDLTFFVDSYPERGGVTKATDISIGLGGAATNYSVAARRAGHRATLYAHIGGLAFSENLLSLLEREGIDTSLVSIHEREYPGIVAVIVDRTGERTMIKYSGANQHLSRVIPESLTPTDYDVVHFASTSPRTVENTLHYALIGNAAVRTRICSYDPGGVYAAERESVRRTLESCARAASTAILFLNEREALVFSGASSLEDAVSVLSSYASTSNVSVVVKLGDRGSLLLRPRGGCIVAEPYRVDRVLDTTGAGDVFDAYFNALLVETSSFERALQYANIAGALKVAKRGSALAAPWRKEVEEAATVNTPSVKPCGSF